MQKNVITEQKPSQPTPKPKGAKAAKNTKEAKLAAALRANILKRKAALKKRTTAPAESSSPAKV